MISLMSAIRRRPGLSRAEFGAYLRDVHGELAARNPLRLTRYVQNHVRDCLAGTRHDRGYAVHADWDNVTELVFEDLAALRVTMGDAYTRDVVGPDGPNFSDTATATAVLVDVQRRPVPRPGPGAVKVFCWLAAAPGVDLDEFAELWDKAHEVATGEQPWLLEPVRGLVHHHQLPAGAPVLAYFGGPGGHVYEGVVSLRFDSPGPALDVAREYLAALGAAAPRPFVDPSRCFTVLADEVTIVERG